MIGFEPGISPFQSQCLTNSATDINPTILPRLLSIRKDVYVIGCLLLKYYALINRARDPYEEIFVLAFKAYGPNEVRSMHLECQNKHFLIWNSSSVKKSFIVYLHK